jgi:hypothetical protein
MPDKETRKFSTKKLPEIYSAMAMLSKLGLSQSFNRSLVKFQKPPISMKSFYNAEKLKIGG